MRLLAQVQLSLFANQKINAYKVLGLPRGASDSEVKNAYHKLARLHHPDLNPQTTEK